MLSTDVAVTFDEDGAAVNGKDTVSLLVARPPMTGGGVKVELRNVSIDVAPGGDTAASRAVARVTCTDPSNGPASEDREVTLEWRKVKSDWLVASARIGRTQG